MKITKEQIIEASKKTAKRVAIGAALVGTGIIIGGVKVATMKSNGYMEGFTTGASKMAKRTRLDEVDDINLDNEIQEMLEAHMEEEWL